MDPDLLDSVLIDQRYRIVKMLGAGAAGRVYQAHDEQLGRNVAVKVIQAKMTQPVLKRFELESRALAKIEHPGIPKLFAWGLTAAKQPYMVMELIEGQPLSDVLNQGRIIDPEKVRQIGIQVCSALHAIHELGFIHRDIKPQNILVETSRGTDIYKLTDFGLVQSLQSDGRVTKTNQLLGTPFYMSPEQAEGKLVGPQSDIYALGCVLYQAVTGAVPFNGISPLEILLKHQSGDFNTLPQNIPGYLSSTIEKCLALAPSERFATAEDLQRTLEKKEPVAAPATRRTLKTKEESKGRLLRPVIFLAVVAAAGIGSVMVLKSGHTSGGTEQAAPKDIHALILLTRDMNHMGVKPGPVKEQVQKDMVGVELVERLLKSKSAPAKFLEVTTDLAIAEMTAADDQPPALATELQNRAERKFQLVRQCLESTATENQALRIIVLENSVNLALGRRRCDESTLADATTREARGMRSDRHDLRLIRMARVAAAIGKRDDSANFYHQLMTNTKHWSVSFCEALIDYIQLLHAYPENYRAPHSRDNPFDITLLAAEEICARIKRWPDAPDPVTVASDRKNALWIADALIAEADATGRKIPPQLAGELAKVLHRDAGQQNVWNSVYTVRLKSSIRPEEKMANMKRLLSRCETSKYSRAKAFVMHSLIACAGKTMSDDEKYLMAREAKLAVIEAKDSNVMDHLAADIIVARCALKAGRMKEALHYAKSAVYIAQKDKKLEGENSVAPLNFRATRNLFNIYAEANRIAIEAGDQQLATVYAAKAKRLNEAEHFERVFWDDEIYRMRMNTCADQRKFFDGIEYSGLCNLSSI